MLRLKSEHLVCIGCLCVLKGTKVPIYSLKSADFTNYTPPLVIEHVHLIVRVKEHTVLQPFRGIELTVHISISVLPGNHLHLSQDNYLNIDIVSRH